MNTSEKKRNILDEIFNNLLIAIILTLFGYILYIIDARWYGWIIVGILFGMLAYLRYLKVWHAPINAIVWSIVMIVSICAVFFSRPNLKVSFYGTMVRESINEIVKHSSLIENDLLNNVIDYTSNKSDWRVPYNYTLKTYIYENVEISRLEKKHGRTDKVILYFHDGLYLLDYNDITRSICYRYSRNSDDASVVMFNTSISISDPSIKALDDANTVWEWLEKEGYTPKDIIIAANGSGANFAIAFIQSLRDQAREMPAALIVSSPWCDSSRSGSSYKDNALRDSFNSSIIQLAIDKYNKNHPIGDSQILMPISDNYEGFPPMLIQVGSYEVVADDADVIYRNAINSGVSTNFASYEGMFHWFQLIGDILPESKKAWEDVYSFIDLTWE